jgi:hypothetical protein
MIARVQDVQPALPSQLYTVPRRPHVNTQLPLNQHDIINNHEEPWLAVKYAMKTRCPLLKKRMPVLTCCVLQDYSCVNFPTLRRINPSTVRGPWSLNSTISEFPDVMIPMED